MWLYLWIKLCSTLVNSECMSQQGLITTGTVSGQFASVQVKRTWIHCEFVDSCGWHVLFLPMWVHNPGHHDRSLGIQHFRRPSTMLANQKAGQCGPIREHHWILQFDWLTWFKSALLAVSPLSTISSPLRSSMAHSICMGVLTISVARVPWGRLMIQRGSQLNGNKHVEGFQF